MEENSPLYLFRVNPPNIRHSIRSDCPNYYYFYYTEALAAVSADITTSLWSRCAEFPLSLILPISDAKQKKKKNRCNFDPCAIVLPLVLYSDFNVSGRDRVNWNPFELKWYCECVNICFALTLFELINLIYNILFNSTLQSNFSASLKFPHLTTHCSASRRQRSWATGEAAVALARKCATQVS